MSREQAAMGRLIPWVIGPLSILVTLNFPASVQLYFASAAFMQYVQTTLWHMPLVRRLAGLPPQTVNSEYQPKPLLRSPFANRPASQGPTYQAPRTINTTATEESSTSSTDETTAPRSPLAMFREAKASLMKTAEPWMAKKSAKTEKERAIAFEKQRKQKENADYLARRARQQRKAGRK